MREVKQAPGYSLLGMRPTRRVDPPPKKLKLLPPSWDHPSRGLMTKPLATVSKPSPDPPAWLPPARISAAAKELVLQPQVLLPRDAELHSRLL